MHKAESNILIRSVKNVRVKLYVTVLILYN